MSGKKVHLIGNKRTRRRATCISLLGRVGFEPTMILNQQIYSLPPLTPQPSSRNLGRALLVTQASSGV